MLSALYANAAFCVYPSHYEGFGLPLVEGFARGRATIASSGGSLAEVAGGIANVLDPENQADWRDMMALWITDVGAREKAAARVRANYQARTWRDVAEDILSVLAPR